MPSGNGVESPSPIGIANLPNQRHKIVAKRGAAFTIMVSCSGLMKFFVDDILKDV
jgi:hypothetical protein